jgi:hypothetical protein
MTFNNLEMQTLRTFFGLRMIVLNQLTEIFVG